MENMTVNGLIVAALLGWSVYTMMKRSKNRKIVAEKLAAGAKVIDVRTAAEFSGGHYPDAINIPLAKLGESFKRIGPKDTSLVVYCASGSRSRRATGILRAAGFTDAWFGGSFSGMPRLPCNMAPTFSASRFPVFFSA
jgi:phage shock protein E